MRCAASTSCGRGRVGERARVRGLDLLREVEGVALDLRREVAPLAEAGRAAAERAQRVEHPRVGRVAAVDAERAADVCGQPAGAGDATRPCAAAPTCRSPRRRGSRSPRSAARRGSGRSSRSGRRAGAAAPAVHPDAHRREVAEVGGLVADAADDRDVALVEQGLELRERRVQADAGRDRQRLAGRDREPGPELVVARSPVGTTVLSPSLPPSSMISTRMPSFGADRRRGERLERREHRARPPRPRRRPHPMSCRNRRRSARRAAAPGARAAPARGRRAALRSGHGHSSREQDVGGRASSSW